MAAKLGGGDEEAITDINITPLVDIILVVLIIFMVTATQTDVLDDSIKVNLPEAASGDETEPSSLGLMVTAEGVLYLDGVEIAEQDLRDFIRTEKADNPELTCLIAADADVPHKRVVWLIDLVKSEGVAKFAINIDPLTVEAGSEGG